MPLLKLDSSLADVETVALRGFFASQQNKGGRRRRSGFFQMSIAREGSLDSPENGCATITMGVVAESSMSLKPSLLLAKTPASASKTPLKQTASQTRPASSSQAASSAEHGSAQRRGAPNSAAQRLALLLEHRTPSSLPRPPLATLSRQPPSNAPVLNHQVSQAPTVVGTGGLASRIPAAAKAASKLGAKPPPMRKLLPRDPMQQVELSTARRKSKPTVPKETILKAKNMVKTATESFQAPTPTQPTPAQLPPPQLTPPQPTQPPPPTEQTALTAPPPPIELTAPPPHAEPTPPPASFISPVSVPPPPSSASSIDSLGVPKQAKPHKALFSHMTTPPPPTPPTAHVSHSSYAVCPHPPAVPTAQVAATLALPIARRSSRTLLRNRILRYRILRYQTLRRARSCIAP